MWGVRGRERERERGVGEGEREEQAQCIPDHVALVYLLPARPLRVLFFLVSYLFFLALLPARPLHTLFHAHHLLGLRRILDSTHAP